MKVYTYINNLLLLIFMQNTLAYYFTYLAGKSCDLISIRTYRNVVFSHVHNKIKQIDSLQLYDGWYMSVPVYFLKQVTK